jgi:hypothetical protein
LLPIQKHGFGVFSVGEGCDPSPLRKRRLRTGNIGGGALLGRCIRKVLRRRHCGNTPCRQAEDQGKTDGGDREDSLHDFLSWVLSNNPAIDLVSNDDRDDEIAFMQGARSVVRPADRTRSTSATQLR